MLEDASLVEENYDDAGQKSWGTFIQVEGTRYATSLFWQPLQNASDPFQEVEEADDEPEVRCRIYDWRSDKSFLYLKL